MIRNRHAIRYGLPLWKRRAWYTSATYDQDAFQFRDDDGDLAGATYLGTLNSNQTLDTGTNYRIRFVIQQTEASKSGADLTFALYYNHEGGGWLPAPTTADGSPVYLNNDGNSIADNAATAQDIGSGTYSSGDSNGYSDGTTDAATGACDFNGAQEVEVEFCFQIDSTQVADEDTIQLRVELSDGTDLNVYTSTPTATVNKAASAIDSEVTLAGGSQVTSNGSVIASGTHTIAGDSQVTSDGSNIAGGTHTIAGNSTTAGALEDITPGPPGGAVASDDFTDSDGTTLEDHSANWTESSSGQFEIYSNALTPSITGGYSGEDAAYWNADSFNDDQYAQMLYVAMVYGGAFVGPAVRVSDGGTYYGWYANSDTVYLFKMVSGSWSQFGSGTGPSNSDTFSVEVEGTTLTPKINGETYFIGAKTDTAIASGSAGVCGYGSSSENYADDWEGGNLGGAVTPVDGEVTVAGGSTVVSYGSVIHAGVSSVAGGSQVTSSGSLVSGGVSTVAGSSQVTSNGANISGGVSTVAGGSQVTSNGATVAGGTSTTSAAAEVTSAGSVIAGGTSGVAGETVEDSSGNLILDGTSAVNGASTTTATGSVENKEEPVDGASTVAGSSTVIVYGSVISSATSALAGEAEVVSAGAVVFGGTSDVEAAGEVVSTGALITGGISGVAAEATEDSDGNLILDATSAVNGASTTAATGGLAGDVLVDGTSTVGGSSTVIVYGSVIGTTQSNVDGGSQVTTIGALIPCGYSDAGGNSTVASIGLLILGGDSDVNGGSTTAAELSEYTFYGSAGEHRVMMPGTAARTTTAEGEDRGMLVGGSRVMTVAKEA